LERWYDGARREAGDGFGKVLIKKKIFRAFFWNFERIQKKKYLRNKDFLPMSL